MRFSFTLLILGLQSCLEVSFASKIPRCLHLKETKTEASEQNFKCVVKNLLFNVKEVLKELDCIADTVLQQMGRYIQENELFLSHLGSNGSGRNVDGQNRHVEDHTEQELSGCDHGKQGPGKHLLRDEEMVESILGNIMADGDLQGNYRAAGCNNKPMENSLEQVKPVKDPLVKYTSIQNLPAEGKILGGLISKEVAGEGLSRKKWAVDGLLGNKSKGGCHIVKNESIEAQLGKDSLVGGRPGRNGLLEGFLGEKRPIKNLLGGDPVGGIQRKNETIGVLLGMTGLARGLLGNNGRVQSFLDAGGPIGGNLGQNRTEGGILRENEVEEFLSGIDRAAAERLGKNEPPTDLGVHALVGLLRNTAPVSDFPLDDRHVNSLLTIAKPVERFVANGGTPGNLLKGNGSIESLLGSSAAAKSIIQNGQSTKDVFVSNSPLGELTAKIVPAADLLSNRGPAGDLHANRGLVGYLPGNSVAAENILEQRGPVGVLLETSRPTQAVLEKSGPALYFLGKNGADNDLFRKSEPAGAPLEDSGPARAIYIENGPIRDLFSNSEPPGELKGHSGFVSALEEKSKPAETPLSKVGAGEDLLNSGAAGMLLGIRKRLGGTFRNNGLIWH